MAFNRLRNGVSCIAACVVGAQRSSRCTDTDTGSSRKLRMHRRLLVSNSLFTRCSSSVVHCQNVGMVWPDVLHPARDILVRIFDPANGALLGCGFVWRRGLIVTSSHLFLGMPDASDVIVQVNSGQRVKAKLLARSDGAVDVAVIRVEDASDLTSVASICPEKPRAGEMVGCVAGAKHCKEIMSPIGAVVATNQQFHGMGNEADAFHFLQVGVITLPGMSGAPIFNSSGQVVGMMQKRFEDYGLALHGKFVDAVAERIIMGLAAVPALGLSLKSHTEGCEQRGIIVTSVADGGLGCRAGIETGDELLVIDDVPCPSITCFRTVLAESRKKVLSVLIRRSGIEKTIHLDIA
jgi:S1-C subfamily serine protease